MLKIINDLKPFFEDCYRRINVREYAKIMHISPPTASKFLAHCNSEGLLMKETYRNYMLFYANKESRDFVDVSRIYWRARLNDIISHMEKRLSNPTIVLFGSLAKAEAKGDSDVDLAIFAPRREISTDGFERNLKRKIQLFWFGSAKDVKSKELADNVLNGYVLRGRIQV